VQFTATVFFVPDVRAALDFYERAFGFSGGVVAEEGDYAEVAVGGAKLGFELESLADEAGLPTGFRRNRREEQPPGLELFFTTDDVEAAVERAVAAGAELAVPPKLEEWGQTIAYVRDPWGVLIVLGTPYEA
jgi:uncharacterized glyoxalase superfamily protein PhnB